jgi:hypothetical protein
LCYGGLASGRGGGGGAGKAQVEGGHGRASLGRERGHTMREDEKREREWTLLGFLT